MVKFVIFKTIVYMFLVDALTWTPNPKLVLIDYNEFGLVHLH